MWHFSTGGVSRPKVERVKAGTCLLMIPPSPDTTSSGLAELGSHLRRAKPLDAKMRFPCKTARGERRMRDGRSSAVLLLLLHSPSPTYHCSWPTLLSLLSIQPEMHRKTRDTKALPPQAPEPQSIHLCNGDADHSHLRVLFRGFLWGLACGKGGLAFTAGKVLAFPLPYLPPPSQALAAALTGLPM